MRTDLLSTKFEKHLHAVKQNYKYAPWVIALLGCVQSVLLVSTPHNASLLFDFAFVFSMCVFGFTMGSLVAWLLQATIAVAKIFECAVRPPVPSCVTFATLPLSFESEVLSVPFPPPRFCLANREAFLSP